jgi:tetratricopeptide (TPR) repeat protein
LFSFLSVSLYLLTHEKQRNKIYSLGFSSVSVMLFIAGFVSVVNSTLLIIGTLLAALSLAVLLWESGSEERYLNLSFKASPKFALALAFIFMVVSAGVAFLFVFMGKVFVADVYAGRAVHMSTSQPSQATANLLARAAQMYPEEGRYYTRLGQEYMALANAEAGKAEKDRDTSTVETYVRQAVSASEIGRKIMPNDVMAVESLALVYENSSLYAKDALSKAEEIYGRAHELEPHNPLYILKLAQVKKAQADAIKTAGADKDALYSQAKDLFQQTIDEKKDLAPAYYGLALTYSSLKDTDKAIENATQAVMLDKTNLNYQYNLGALYQLRDGDGDSGRAEALYLGILDKNEKLIDVRLSLGILYEKANKKDIAIEQYQKILDLFPSDVSGNAKDTRDQVQKLIDNVKSGVGNLKKAQEATAAVAPTPEAPAPATVPTVPTGPNASPLAPANGQ